MELTIFTKDYLTSGYLDQECSHHKQNFHMGKFYKYGISLECVVAFSVS